MLDHPALRRWLDRGLSALERRSVDRLRLVPRRPPLLVVGPPRCGTTALFLSLVNAWHLSFVPNVSKRHPRAPFAYGALGAWLHPYRPTLSNRYGVVDQPMGPSDAWDLFLRWMPNDYVGAAPDPRAVRELRTLARLFEWLGGGPLCVRNNVNSLRVAALDAVFPDAVWVGITRDWREAALSLADAYRDHATPADAWWSAGPPDVDPAALAGPLEKAVFQILGVEAILRRDLLRLPAERRLLVRYEDFCADPEAVLAWVRAAYARRGVSLVPRAGAAGSLRARRSGRRIGPDHPAAAELATAALRFFRGAHLRSERVLSVEVRAGAGAAA